MKFKIRESRKKKYIDVKGHKQMEVNGLLRAREQLQTGSLAALSGLGETLHVIWCPREWQYRCLKMACPK